MSANSFWLRLIFPWNHFLQVCSSHGLPKLMSPKHPIFLSLNSLSQNSLTKASSGASPEVLCFLLYQGAKEFCYQSLFWLCRGL